MTRVTKYVKKPGKGRLPGLCQGRGERGEGKEGGKRGRDGVGWNGDELKSTGKGWRDGTATEEMMGCEDVRM